MLSAAQSGPPMTISKYRAAIVVFLVGFALGLSVFVASRLFVRTILSSDAIVAAEELAARLAEGKAVEASGIALGGRPLHLFRPGRKGRRERRAGQRVGSSSHTR